MRGKYYREPKNLYNVINYLPNPERVMQFIPKVLNAYQKKVNLFKIKYMAAPSLDHEFNKYWALLSPVQKESLLSVIKSFVVPRERMTIEEYNREIDEAIARVEAGEFYTMEEVEKMSKEW